MLKERLADVDHGTVNPPQRIGRGLLGTWLAAVFFGTVLLWRHDLGGGELAAAPAAWPADSTLAPAHTRPTLLLWLHPLCPCGRASLGELAHLLDGREARVNAFVVLVTPEDAGWADGELAEEAQAIPGVVLVRDPGAHEALRFGALTSGQVLAYDSGGALVFRGGITPARGHAGESLGRSTLETWLDTEVAPVPALPVFGCRMPVTSG